MENLKVGDHILYQSWRGELVNAKVEQIELCRHVNQKNGKVVQSVSLDDINRTTLCMDNWHWCYGYQVFCINGRRI